MVTITGDKGYTQYRVNGGSESVYDISAASWRVNNNPDGSVQKYPFFLDGHTVDVEIIGNGNMGSGPYNFDGLMSLTADWGQMYGWGNSAAVISRFPLGLTHVRGVSFYRCWDAIRVSSRESPFLIEDCYVNITRDDCVECDDGNSGLIRNCLFEDCFSGMSFGNTNTPASSDTNVIEISNVLQKLRKFNYRGDPSQHGAVIKVDQHGARLLIKNSVFAITRADHEAFPRQQLAFDRVLSGSSGNYLLNLTDDALPGNYPTLPPSFTLLNGATARDYWDAARAAFIAADNSPPVNPPAIQPEILHVLEINPTSGAIRVKTPKAYVADVTVGAENSYGSSMQTVTLTVA